MPRLSFFALTALVAGALALGGCGDSDEETTQPVPPKSNAAAGLSKGAPATESGSKERGKTPSQSPSPAKSSYPMPRDGGPNSQRSGHEKTGEGSGNRKSGRAPQEEKQEQVRQAPEEPQQSDPRAPAPPADAPRSDPPDPPDSNGSTERSDPR